MPYSRTDRLKLQARTYLSLTAWVRRFTFLVPKINYWVSLKITDGFMTAAEVLRAILIVCSRLMTRLCKWLNAKILTSSRILAPTYRATTWDVQQCFIDLFRIQFRLITCGSDKSLYVCVINNNTGKAEISREQHFVEKHSMGDMAIVE